MPGFAVEVAVVACVLGACCTPEQQDHSEQDRSQKRVRRAGRLDKSHAFFYREAKYPPDDRVLATMTIGSIRADTLARYATGHSGRRLLQDLAFDLAVTHECRSRRLAGSSPVLARSSAMARYHESGRRAPAATESAQLLKFANEAMRKLRIDALVGELRAADDRAVAAMFDRRYGVGGERVAIRHVLVSFRATRRRLAAAGKPTDATAVRTAARARADRLVAKLTANTNFTELLRESDDRLTRTMLRDPKRRADAGSLPGYNYQRYGDDFAAAVRGLAASGAVSPPVPSTVGFHLIELGERRVTRLEDVAAELRVQLRREPATPTDIRALRRRLLRKFEFTPK